MRLEHLDVHLNELLHDLGSPLSSMRLQLGLLRDALRGEAKLLRRVENAEAQLLRSQRIIDAFASACALKTGVGHGNVTFRRVLERFGFELTDESGDAVVGVDEEGLDFLARSIAEGCAALMAPGSVKARITTSKTLFVLRVTGSFDPRVMARALRLSFVADDGSPQLGLAATRIGAAAVNGTLLLDRDALVLRLPLAEE